MDQQGAQVGIAALADAQESRFATAGVLSRHDAHPGGHLSAIFEGLAIAQGGHQCRGGDRSDPRDGQELLTRGALLADRFDLMLIRLNLPVEIDQTIIAVGKHPARQRTETILGVLQDLRQAPAQLTQTLGHHETVFAQQPACLIGGSRALLDEVLADPMQHLNVLLFGTLQRHKAHARPAHRFTDRLGIVRVILVALDIGFHELRRNQASVMPHLLQLSSPVMGTGTRLKADHRRRQVGKER